MSMAGSRSIFCPSCITARPSKNGWPTTACFQLCQLAAEEDLRPDPLRSIWLPGQMLVMTCRPDHPGSLGHYFFTEPVGDDALAQRMLVVRLARPARTARSPRSSRPKSIRRRDCWSTIRQRVRNRPWFQRLPPRPPLPTTRATSSRPRREAKRRGARLLRASTFRAHAGPSRGGQSQFAAKTLQIRGGPWRRYLLGLKPPRPGWLATIPIGRPSRASGSWP